MCSLNLRRPPHFERLTCGTSLSYPDARAFSYFRVSTVTIDPTSDNGYQIKVSSGQFKNGSDNGDYKIMNFWDWPCELFFSSCTFSVFTAGVIIVLMSVFLAIALMIVWHAYTGIKNEK